MNCVVNLSFICTVWMNVLRRVPQAILVLLTGGLPSERRLLAEAAAAGIHVDRIVFLNKVYLRTIIQSKTYVLTCVFVCVFAWDRLIGNPICSGPPDVMLY